MEQIVPYKAGEDLIQYMKELAICLHEGQLRSDGQPYIVHPEQVANIVNWVLKKSIYKKSAIGASWGHDVVEDIEFMEVQSHPEEKRKKKQNEISLNDLLQEAEHEGTFTCQFIDRVTNRGKRYMDYMEEIFRIEERTKEQDQIALIIKMADRTVNADPTEDADTSKALAEYEQVYKENKKHYKRRLEKFYKKWKVDFFMLPDHIAYDPKALEWALKERFKEKKKAIAFDNLSLYFPRAETTLLVPNFKKNNRIFHYNRLRELLLWGFCNSLCILNDEMPGFVSLMRKIGFNRGNEKIEGYKSLRQEVRDKYGSGRCPPYRAPI